MASKEETETVIIINAADMADGYFRFSTSDKLAYQRLIRRIGGERNLKELVVGTSPKGTPIYWTCFVPSKYLSRSTYAIRRVSEDRKNKLRVRARKTGFGSRTTAPSRGKTA